MRSVRILAILALMGAANPDISPLTGVKTGAAFAQPVTEAAITVDTQNIISSVPATVYGQGLLNYVASDAFARSQLFADAVKASNVGALRWPGAGHSNIPIFHFDNRHTYYTKNGPYTTKSKGNIWDPLYPPGDSGPADEIVTLGGFVAALRNTNTVPLMIFTWRSAVLWRDIDGKKVYYRDPDPLTLDGAPMPAAEAAKLSSQDMQTLENRRMLKTYFDLGGPADPVIQVGEELWAGWEDGQIPWQNPELNPKNLPKIDWIAEAIKPYFTDLAAFAKASGYKIRLAVQFREATSGGDKMPMPKKQVAFLRKDFDTLLTNMGPQISYMTASVHYRGTWARWLTEPQMQMAFLTDAGQGSLADIRAWFRAYVAEKGYPAIDIIPHANSFGQVADGEVPPEGWQAGLMAAQYMIESIKAGYEYTFGFPGFGGDYTGVAGQNSESRLGAEVDGVYEAAPIFNILGGIGAALQNKAQLVAVESADEGVISLGLVTTEPDGARSLHLYLINKHDTGVSASVRTDMPIAAAAISVSRYSKTETAFPDIPAAGVIGLAAGNGTTMKVALTPFSMTAVKINLN